MTRLSTNYSNDINNDLPRLESPQRPSNNHNKIKTSRLQVSFKIKFIKF